MSQSQPVLYQTQDKAGQPVPAQGQAYPPGQQPQFIQQAPPGTVTYPPGQPPQFVQQAPPQFVQQAPPQFVQQAPPGAVTYPAPGPVMGQAYPPGPPQFVQQSPPGAIPYYPNVQGAGGGPQVIMASVQRQAPVYKYTPSSFRMLSIVILILFGIFSPITFAFTIPALLYANKSEASSKSGNTKVARAQGMTAAYLIVLAVVVGLVLAIVLTSVVLGVYGRQYALKKCIETIRARNGGVIPSSRSSSYYNYLYC